jgi:hypothetical protein
MSSPAPAGGDLDDNNGQAKVQVLSEASAGDALPEVPVRGREDAGVTRNLLPASDSLEALLLEKAQELHLRRRRQFTDLVKEERAPRGGLDVPYALRVSARERALLVTKEFALEQVLRDRVAVDGDERAGRNLRLFRYSAEYRSSCRSSPLKICCLDSDYAGSRIRDFTGYFAKPLSKVTSVAPFTAAYAAR